MQSSTLLALTLVASLATPPVRSQCDSTFNGAWQPNNGGSVGGQIYFDVVANQPLVVTSIEACLSNGGTAPPPPVTRSTSRSG